MGCHALPQVIFPVRGSNPGVLHCRQILYHVGHQESLLSKEDRMDTDGVTLLYLQDFIFIFKYNQCSPQDLLSLLALSFLNS